ncbi:MAG TPA: cyclic nucleotide-binding domain-containing protein [Ignavibacteriaceae bacterium]
MNNHKTIDLIKSNDLFKNLDFDSLNFPYDENNFLEFKEGDLIYSSGQSSDNVFLLIDGEVKIKLNTIKRLFFKSPNEFFGEAEVLQKEPRNSSALANTNCMLYKIDENFVNKLFNDHSPIKVNLNPDGKIESTENNNDIKIIEQETESSETAFPESVVENEKSSYDFNHPEDENNLQEDVLIDNNNTDPGYYPESETDYSLEEKYPDSNENNFNPWEFNTSKETSNFIRTDLNPESVLNSATETLDDFESGNKEMNPEIEPDEINETENSYSISEPTTQKFEQFEINSDALSKFAEFIMQDVKSPLLTIKHYSSILSRFDLSDEVKKVISLISSQTISVLDLLQASIDYSEKNTKTKLDEVSFNEVMNNNLIMLSDYVESRNVKLFKKIGEDAKVNIDVRKFYVACYYISRFACDMMKHGGKLFFSTKIENNSVVLNIKDENVIVTKEILDKVFDLTFVTANESYTGLSLAISKFLLEAMQIDLQLQTDGSGTNYIVSIPVSLL